MSDFVGHTMAFFWLSLIANTVALVVAIAAAITRPITSYRLIAGVAICAFLASLHQVITKEGNVLALFFNILLVALMYCRHRINLAIVKKNRRS